VWLHPDRTSPAYFLGPQHDHLRGKLVQHLNNQG
jgi:hypothetical protein